jgi:hypothetical protein
MKRLVRFVNPYNARYAHASLGLRYLLANMGELQPVTRLQEFVIGARTTDDGRKAAGASPRIIGFGVYIWNVEETTKVVACSSASRRRSRSCWAGRKCRTNMANRKSCAGRLH